MLKYKITIQEENDFLELLERNIQGDFDAMNESGFYIGFIHRENEIIVLIYGEKSLVRQIDDFIKHLNDHYINGLG